MIVNMDPFKRFVEIWLYSMFILVFLIVAVGGLTRLTDSGLSITEWELFKGILPPLTDSKWLFYFDEYKKIPEYVEINYNMTLSEFKVIYYWEYGHRILARLIGLFSIIPMIYLFFKFKKERKNIFKYSVIFILICVQGFVGWFMVSSGLIENTDVSHYRLALHLSLALTILSIIFWFIMETIKISPFKKKFNNSFLNFFFILIILQIVLGAFLAGMDGGLIYNSWPDMNGNFLPNDINNIDLFLYSSLDNPSVVQFYHRFTAYLLFISLLFLNYYTYRTKIDFKPVLIFNIAIFVQIVLGIVTLITGVKITYASLHQLGSVFVLTSFLYIKYKNTIN
ncbi:COX15/CtaA family protein [Candidatus Pelagibacter bacterium]|nr:COX15/CtaA family protein [Candidatus Pelagibacter bacterium]